MRLKTILKLLSLSLVAVAMESCLKGDPSNFPPGAQTPFLIMTNNASGTDNRPLSGLNYFGNQTLSYPHADEKDTMTFFVAIEGGGNAGKDINITLTNPADALDDNYANDSLTYLMMPDSLYDFVSTTGKIAKGTAYATFQVVFYPSKFDQSQNYMLPISASNDSNVKIASNYGTLYYHVVGNVLAGSYTWKYRRWNGLDTTLSTNGTASGNQVWAPNNSTTLTFNGGYAQTVGLNAPYVLSFDQAGNGTISNFKVKIDATLAGGLSANGISITQDPAIMKMTITPSGRYFKIWYRVNNGTADRTLIDEYWYP